MKLPSLLDISTYAFGASFPLTTLRRIPILSEILAIPVFVLWVIGYSTWYLGSFFHPDKNQQKADSWYGFMEFKKQHQAAALIGLIATVLGFILPTLIAPIAWLFMIGNVFWSISNYHEASLPHPDDPTFSSKKQKLYAYFSVEITALSLIAAVSATILMLFPLAAPVALPILEIIAAIISIIAIATFLYYFFSKSEPDNPVTINTSEPASEPTQNNSEQLEPTFYNHPVHQVQQSEKNTPDADINLQEQPASSPVII